MLYEVITLKKRAPIVDIVLGPQTYHRLPEMVVKALREDGVVLDTEFPVEPKFDFLPPPGADGPAAFLAIQEGCDRFCTYCVVPYTRGAEYARPAADVIAEAKRLVATGAREITLLGQNVNAWAADGWSFGRLLRVITSYSIHYTKLYEREVVERRAHVEFAALGVEQGEVDGGAAAVRRAAPRVGDELRVRRVVPQHPLRLGGAEGVEDLEPEPLRGGEVAGAFELGKRFRVQITCGALVHRRSGEIVGGGVGKVENDAVGFGRDFRNNFV